MTIESPSYLLRDRLMEAFNHPLNELGTKALDSFLALPLIKGWCPQNMYLAELTKLIDIGLPFSLLAGNATADAHRRQFADAASRGERVPDSLSSEVHVGALLSYWGANVKFVPCQPNQKTPDIEANWGDGQTFDVEVVQGDTRPLHRDVKSGLDTFIGALRPGDVAWNIAGFISDASNSADLATMFDAAVTLCPEQSEEAAGRWYVRAVAPQLRDDVVGAHSTELFGPSWWPKDEPSYFATSTLLGATVNPVVLLRSLVPIASYTNPILRKATSGQSCPGKPYLIALDVSELPRAHERIVKDLYEYFKIWDHVTAVLLFESRFYVGIERKEWVVSILPNPTASISLPPQLTALSKLGRFSVEFKLSEG